MTDYANQMSEQEEDTQRGQYLTFLLDTQSYAIEINYVTEIIGVQPVIGIPDQFEYMKGIINLRGKIIPIMDIQLRFGKKSREYNERTCIVVVDIRNMSIGLIVDQVAEVISIPEEQVDAPPSTIPLFLSPGNNGTVLGSSGMVILPLFFLAYERTAQFRRPILGILIKIRKRAALAATLESLLRHLVLADGRQARRHASQSHQP